MAAFTVSDDSGTAAILRRENPDIPSEIINAHSAEIDHRLPPICQFVNDAHRRSDIVDISEFITSRGLTAYNDRNRQRLSLYMNRYGPTIFHPLCRWTADCRFRLIADCNEIIRTESHLLSALQRPNQLQDTMQWTQFESRYPIEFSSLYIDHRSIG